MNERLNTYQAGAFLPALQAVVTGVLFTAIISGVVLVTGAEPVWLLLGGGFVAFVAWLALLKHWLKLVDWQEGYQEPEPVILDPDPPAVRIELLERREGSWTGEYLNLPVTPAQLRLLSSGVVSGGTLSENAWCGSNRPFTKRQFHQLRQALLERGWLEWRNMDAPAQGVQASRVGMRVFSYLAENRLLPPAELEPGEDW